MAAGLKRSLFVILVIAAVFLPSPTAAWGDFGHEIVCSIAMKLLTQPDRDEVERLATAYKDPDGHSVPSFAEGCTFPDFARNNAKPKAKKPEWQKAFSSFNNWHFVNVAPSTQTVPATCSNCIFSGIRQHLREAGDQKRPAPERGMALLFLGHWIGDLHQPLHVSFREDNGGNDITVLPPPPFYTSASDGIAMHSVWDTGIIKKAMPSGTGWRTMATTLRAGITPALQKAWLGGSTRAWAQESYDITLLAKTKYCEMKGTKCESLGKTRAFGSDYQTDSESTVKERLQRGGVRLASLLRQAIHSK